MLLIFYFLEELMTFKIIKFNQKIMKTFLHLTLLGVAILIISYASINSLEISPEQQLGVTDSLQKARNLLEEAKVKSEQKGIEIIIRNVDISRCPDVKIIVEAYNTYGYPLDTLYAENLTVLENGVEKKVISAEKISVNERVPVDFIFIIDKTGSMQKYIDDVKKNISNFTTNLVRRGIDYNIGLILFSDYVEDQYQPTDNVIAFLGWLSYVRAQGGFDEKENALEALEAACKMKFRPLANKVAVLITDAPYHSAGEQGEGTTDQTLESIIELLKKNDVRLFSIVPPKLKNYERMSKSTRGSFFDIDYPFSTILDNFSNQLTSVYALKYRSEQKVIPDSINIALLNEQKQQLVRKIIPIVELGRKLIIENLLYKFGSFDLPDTVIELEVLKEFMINKPNVAILVEGHTDSVGTNIMNDKLSLLRAESVKNYLIKKGINAQRIRTKGYGKRRPIATNETEFGRKLNRRTEIVIIGK
jgi:outer membrane protein OmpA-like peptidoglycan-associated protein/Mg-chelatase subunit ChlD